LLVSFVVARIADDIVSGALPGDAGDRLAHSMGHWRLSDRSYASGKLEYPSRHVQLPESVLEAQLEAATRILSDAQRRDGAAQGAWAPAREGQYEQLRWFAMPEEVAHDLQQAAPE
jgi:hypothetical protein